MCFLNHWKKKTHKKTPRKNPKTASKYLQTVHCVVCFLLSRHIEMSYVYMLTLPTFENVLSFSKLTS